MSELDRALDAALRDLVADDGPPDLRRRVLARIQEPAPRPAAPWPALAAAAAIAAAVAGVALLRTDPGRETVPPAAGPPASMRPAAPAADTRGAAASPPAPSLPAAAARLRSPRAARPAAEATPDFAAAGDLEPIELAPLAAVVPIGGERIAVSALTVERIEIEPLAEPQP